MCMELYIIMLSGKLISLICCCCCFIVLYVLLLLLSCRHRRRHGRCLDFYLKNLVLGQRRSSSREWKRVLIFLFAWHTLRTRAAITTARSINTMNNNRIQGTVKWFSNQKGYGFITSSENNEDVFVHQTEVDCGDAYRSLVSPTMEFCLLRNVTYNLVLNPCVFFLVHLRIKDGKSSLNVT